MVLKVVELAICKKSCAEVVRAFFSLRLLAKFGL
jgi:hypothetical protein